MLKLILISKTITRVPNPLFYSVVQERTKDDEAIFIVHTAELAVEFKEFDFLSNRLGKHYWFDDITQLDGIVTEIIDKNYWYYRLIATYLDDIDFGPDEVFYYTSDNVITFLIKNVIKLNLNISNHLLDENLVVKDVIDTPFTKFIGYDDVKTIMHQYGYLDEIYAEHHLKEYLKKIDREDYILFLYREMYELRNAYQYGMDDDNTLTSRDNNALMLKNYNNPHKNVLLVEKMLEEVEFYNIDIELARSLDLKFDYLPAKYNYSGFYTTTGRIYCNSEEFSSLQNLPEDKRRILNADPGCVLIEFDFKSFEYDLMCQIVDYPITADPHMEIYNRLFDFDLPRKRDIGKKINYSFLYGMSDVRIADMLINEYKIKDAFFKEKFIERLHDEKLYQLVKEFEAELLEDMRYNIIDNWFKRNIHCKKDYAVLSNYISSTATDIVYYKMLHIADMMDKPGDRILLQKHDSILIQLTDESIEGELFEKIYNYLGDPVGGLKGRVSYEYGRNWGNME